MLGTEALPVPAQERPGVPTKEKQAEEGEGSEEAEEGAADIEPEEELCENEERERENGLPEGFFSGVPFAG